MPTGHICAALLRATLWLDLVWLQCGRGSKEVPFPFAQPVRSLPKITDLSRARSNPLKERCFCYISLLLAGRAGWPCGKVPNYPAAAQPRCSGLKPLCCRHCFPHTVCPWQALLLGLSRSSTFTGNLWSCSDALLGTPKSVLVCLCPTGSERTVCSGHWNLPLELSQGAHNSCGL